MDNKCITRVLLSIFNIFLIDFPQLLIVGVCGAVRVDCFLQDVVV